MTEPACLRVALCSTQRGWRGGEEQARLLFHGLRSRGHECLVLARRGGKMAERMADEGFTVRAFAGRGRNLLALAEQRAALRRFRPDVLHLNDGHSLTAAPIAAVGLPMARVVSRRVDFPLKRSWHFRRLADRVVCVSRAVADICQAGGVPPSMLRVVHDGVDPARAASGDAARGRRSLELPPDALVAVTVAALVDHKGHRFLLDALPRVVARHPRLVVLLAGVGDQEAALRRQCRQLGLDGHVRFLGFRSDAPDLTSLADLFVMPSHLEGLCSSLIDAMLAERPIVATTAGGIPELLLDGVSAERPIAWTVPPRSPETLAEAMIEALADAAQRRLRAERARQHALAHFTDQHMVEATVAVYREAARVVGRAA